MEGVKICPNVRMSSTDRLREMRTGWGGEEIRKLHQYVNFLVSTLWFPQALMGKVIIFCRKGALSLLNPLFAQRRLVSCHWVKYRISPCNITQGFHTIRINLSPFTKDFRVWEILMRESTFLAGSSKGSNFGFIIKVFNLLLPLDIS